MDVTLFAKMMKKRQNFIKVFGKGKK